MQPEKVPEKKSVPSHTKKYNYEAMSAYNFDKIDFDFDLGNIDEKQHSKIIESAEEVDREEAEKKQKK